MSRCLSGEHRFASGSNERKPNAKGNFIGCVHHSSGPGLAFRDDAADNRFLETSERYPGIEEDEPARWLLVSEYGALLD